MAITIFNIAVVIVETTDCSNGIFIPSAPTGSPNFFLTSFTNSDKSQINLNVANNIPTLATLPKVSNIPLLSSTNFPRVANNL